MQNRLKLYTFSIGKNQFLYKKPQVYMKKQIKLSVKVSILNGPVSKTKLPESVINHKFKW